jgi:hypothetical protein
MSSNFTKFIIDDVALRDTLLPMLTFGNVRVARMEAETA